MLYEVITIAIKEAVFPFNKLYGADLVLSPEMKSTGEVMGISSNFGVSFAKSQLAAGNKIPTSGTCFLSFIDIDNRITSYNVCYTKLLRSARNAPP